MNYTVLGDDELDGPTTNAATNAEPMRKPDHKAKKHGKPYKKTKTRKPLKLRPNEELGGGFFVFGRLPDNRIHPRHAPFEHGSFDAANDEAYRLAEEFGGQFEVYRIVNYVNKDTLNNAE